MYSPAPKIFSFATAPYPTPILYTPSPYCTPFLLFEEVVANEPMAAITLSPFAPTCPILSPKPRFSLNTHNSSLSNSITSSTLPLKRAIHFNNPLLKVPLKSPQIWKITAVSGDALPVEANQVENSEQIVASGGGDAASTIISVLLFLAFLALSILTIGVIYIAVTDFLTRRESDKFAKEEKARNKKRKKGGRNKRLIRARAGPRGFGQKKVEEDD